MAPSPRSHHQQMYDDHEELEERLRIVGDYKTGSIARIKLKNFLTYNEVECRPGPRLNMVIGPNGTGKSSILCAICLGLGGEPRLLGRATDVDTFVKNGEEVAEIEIEVVEEDGNNVIVQRTIRKDGKPRSAFLWNGEQIAGKVVKERVAERWNIQLGNLCTFLPQEKVGSFSGFDSKSLLLETEKTIGNNEELYKTHMKLIEKQEALAGGDDRVEALESKLASLTATQRSLSRQVEEEEKRRKAVENVEYLKKKILWLKTDNLREKALQLKEQKEEAKCQFDEAKKVAKPLVAAVNEAQARLEQAMDQMAEFDKIIEAKRKEINKNSTKRERHEDEADSLLHDLTAMDNERLRWEEDADEIREKIEKLTKLAEDFPSVGELQNELDLAIKDKQATLPEYQSMNRELGGVIQDLNNSMGRIRHLEAQVKKGRDEKAQQRQKVFGKFPEIKKAYEWIRHNRNEFRKPVIGPIACEMKTKSHVAADYLEQHIPNAVLKSFVVQDKSDYDMIYNELRMKQKIPVNLIQIDRVSAPEARFYSDEFMDTLKSEHGILGYLDELFEADPIITEAIKSTATVQKVLVGNDFSQESYDKRDLGNLLSQPKVRGGRMQGYCLFTSNRGRPKKFTGIVSKYQQKITVRQDDIKRAGILSHGAGDEQNKQNIEALEAEKAEAQKLHQQRLDLEEKVDASKKRVDDAANRMKEIRKDIKTANDYQRKGDIQKEKLAAIEKELDQDDEEKRRKLKEDISKRVLGSLKAIKAQSECQKVILSTHVRATGAQLNRETASADVSRTRMEFDDAQERLAEAKKIFDQMKDKFKKIKDEARQMKEIAEAEAPIHDEDGNPTRLKEILEEEYAQFSTLEDAEAAKENAERTLKEIMENPNAFRQFKENEKQIEEATAELDDLKYRKDKKKTELQNLQQTWEKSLDYIISEIDKLFSQYMRELGCVGSVSLFKGSKDDPNPQFRDYGIEIKVSFRQGVAPSVLSSRVQSGGERSVSTIMYLMALQDEMNAPFRCVDEINQGLDERNERLVFKRIVENSTQPPGEEGPTDHCGQYWLITPKLLPNLTDMEVEAMTVICIFNGPYNLKHPSDWDTQKLLRLRQDQEDDDDDDEETDTRKRIPKRRKRKSEEIEVDNVDDDEESNVAHDEAKGKRTRRNATIERVESEEEPEVETDEDDF